MTDFFNIVSDGLDIRPKYSGIFHCMKCVWQQEGLRGLYQGVTPNVWGAGASWGLYFFLYVSTYNSAGLQLVHDVVFRQQWCFKCEMSVFLALQQLQCHQRLHEGRPSD